MHLEGVLSDQIVVTNVDDALGFGDPSALEVLDETDPQVSSHLTHISEILSHSNPNQQVVRRNLASVYEFQIQKSIRKYMYI